MTASDKGLAATEEFCQDMARVLLRHNQASRSDFDVILLDCPPNLGNLTLNAMAADYCGAL